VRDVHADLVVARLVAGEARGLHQREPKRGRSDEDRRPDPDASASAETGNRVHVDACNTR
jgi:hypothetical protein